MPPIDVITFSYLVVFAVFSLTLLQLLKPKTEYRLPPHLEISWNLHHDEKLIVQDARYFYLKAKNKIDINDYKPYSMFAAFGIAGPMLAGLGFKLFGLNNFGLRFFFIILSSVSNLFCTLCILKAAPGYIGIALCLAYLLNYSNFVVTRHAILENILTLYFTAILYFYITNSQGFSEYIHWFGFFAASSLLFKPNFAVYVYAFLFCTVVIDQPVLQQMIKFILWSLAGIVSFEGSQMAVLRKMGIARWRYFNLVQAIRQHRGHNLKILHHFQPEGLKIFPKCFIMFADWYGFSITPWENWKTGWNYIFFLSSCAIGGGLFFLGALFLIPAACSALAMFMVFYLGCASFLFFYLKRAYLVFPLTVVFLALFSQSAADGILKYSSFGKSFVIGAAVAAGFLSLFNQTRRVFSFPLKFSNAVARNSRSLEKDLPENSVIYAHCYALRAFWQIASLRIMSCDDQFMNNEMIVEWAVENDARYVLLSINSGVAPSVSGGSLNFDTFTRLQYVRIYGRPEDVVTGGHILFKILPEPAFKLVGVNSIICDENDRTGETHGSTMHRCGGELLDGATIMAINDCISRLKRLGYNDLAENLQCRLSCDEQRISNSQNINNALVLKKKYVLLSEDGGPLDLVAVSTLKHINNYYQTENDMKRYALIEIGTQDIDNHQPAVIEQPIMKFFYQCCSKLKSLGHNTLAKNYFFVIEKERYHLWGVYFHLGEIFLNSGEHKEAMNYFSKCVKLNPWNVKAKQYLRQYDN